MQTLVIDCSGLCYKGFYSGVKDLEYHERLTGVSFNFLLQIFKLSKKIDSNKFIFCWDSGKRDRKKIFSEYKKKRVQKTDEELEDRKLLYSQMHELRINILPNLGFRNNLIQTGYEADDLIAQVVMDNPGMILVSADKDMYQLLDYCDIYPDNKNTFTKQDFIDLYGIQPNQWAMAKAIGGCDSDEVPGIKGVADPAKSIKSKSLTYIKGELIKGMVFDRIESEEGQEIIKRNLKLVKLPFGDKGKRDLCFDEKFLFDDWIEVFERYGFRSFLEKKYLGNLEKYFRLEK